MVAVISSAGIGCTSSGACRKESIGWRVYLYNHSMQRCLTISSLWELTSYSLIVRRYTANFFMLFDALPNHS